MELTEEIKKEIDALSQEEMARLWRFTPPGHPFFKHDAVGDYFEKSFREKGFFTPEISKKIGCESRTSNREEVKTNEHVQESDPESVGM